MTEEQEQNAYEESIKQSLKIAFDAIGISAKATTDDLISLAENEEEDANPSNAIHRRKGLKLPAIYSSKQYEEHLYLGMIEINEIEEDDLPPDLLGDDYNNPPEGFGDPFANDPNPLGNDDFNPPQEENRGLFANVDETQSQNFGNVAPPPPNGAAPPPPPPPGGPPGRTGSVPPPPPPQPQGRAPSTDNRPAFMQDIDRLKAEKDAEANLVGDPSEAGSFHQPPPPQNLAPAGAPGRGGPPPPPPGGMFKNNNPNDSFDPLADESLFMGSNAIKNKYNNKPNKRNMFDESMAGGKGLFDDTMNQDMSMSIDQGKLLLLLL